MSDISDIIDEVFRDIWRVEKEKIKKLAKRSKVSVHEYLQSLLELNLDWEESGSWVEQIKGKKCIMWHENGNGKRLSTELQKEYNIAEADLEALILLFTEVNEAVNWFYIRIYLALEK